MKMMIERIDVLKKTNDDWYPCIKVYNPNTKPKDYESYVRVSFLELQPINEHSYKWRVCVWGNDDCGMERDYMSKQEALQAFIDIISWGSVDMEPLNLKHGFYSA